MAKETKNNKPIIIGACVAVLIIAAIVIAIILINNNQGINDSYFVSDGTKYVLTMDADGNQYEEYAPLKTHYVYYYKGNEITGMKCYLEYPNNDSAKETYELMMNTDNYDAIYKSVSLNGKYVVLESNESDYENTTAEDVKQQIEFIESLKDYQVNYDGREETVIVEAAEE